MNNNNTPNFEQIISIKDFDKVYKEAKKEATIKKKMDKILKKYPLPQTKP